MPYRMADGRVEEYRDSFLSVRISPESDYAGIFQYVIVILLPVRCWLSVPLFEIL